MRTPLLIAEVGSVHDGSFGNAKKLIDLAAQCGADAVKFQTHISDAETLPNAASPSYFKDESRAEYFRRTEFSKSMWRELAEHAQDIGICFLSSPFSLEAVDLLEDIEMLAYKIPSGEVTNLPLIQKIAQVQKPVLLSSGMSNWGELDQAVATLSDVPWLSIMQCTSAYPCSAKMVGLNIIDEIHDRYPNVVLGFSDHTLGPAAAIAAAGRGALVIEKHLTFSRHMYGSDAKHSMEPQEFAQLSRWLEEVWSMMDSPVDKNVFRDDILEMKKIFEKSIVLKKEISKGMQLVFEDLSFKKPGDGIAARHYEQVLGRITTRNLKTNHKLTWDDLI